MEPTEIGKYIREKRKKQGMTLSELAKVSGVSQPHLSHIENGKRGIPSPEILKKLAKPLGTTFWELMMAAGHATYEDISDLKLDVKEFGEYLKELREERGLTLTQLGDKIGYSNPYLSQIETGKKKNFPSPKLLKKISKALNVPYVDLLQRAGYEDLSNIELFKEMGYDSKSIIPTKLYTADIVKILNLEQVGKLYYHDRLLTERDRKKILIMLDLLFDEMVGNE